MYNFLFNQTPLKFFAQSLWRDEAFSVLISQQSITNLLQLTARDFNPPLYYLLLKVWIGIFGQSEIAIRTLSLIFFWATCYVFYLILTEVLKIKPKKTIPYLFLFVINPFLHYYAFEARMYLMLTFLVTLSYYCLFTKRKTGHVISIVLGLYTHYAMTLVVLLQFLVASNKREFLKSSVYIGLAYIPWIIFFLTQHQFTKEAFWALAQPQDTILRIGGIIYTGYENEFGYYEQHIRQLSLGLLGFIGASYYQFRQKIRRPVFFNSLLIWTFLPCIFLVLISLFTPFFVPRYIIFSSVGIMLIIVSLLEKFPQVFKVIFLVIFFIITLQYNKLQIEEREKTDIRKAIKEIKAMAKKDDLLYVVSELDVHTAVYYFGETNVFIYGRTYQEIPNYVGKVLIPENKIATTLPDFPKRAFILKEDGSYEIQANF